MRRRAPLIVAIQDCQALNRAYDAERDRAFGPSPVGAALIAVIEHAEECVAWLVPNYRAEVVAAWAVYEAEGGGAAWGRFTRAAYGPESEIEPWTLHEVIRALSAEAAAAIDQRSLDAGHRRTLERWRSEAEGRGERTAAETLASQTKPPVTRRG